MASIAWGAIDPILVGERGTWYQHPSRTAPLPPSLRSAPSPPKGRGSWLQGTFAHLDLEGFEIVAGTDVDEVLRERDTAFQTGPNFRHVVLEAA